MSADDLTCAGLDCARTDRLRRGLCPAHYRRLERHGDPNYVADPKRGQVQAFVRSVLDGTAPVELNGCILWPFNTRNGYAAGRWNGRTEAIARVVLEHALGPPPTPDHQAGHAPHSVCGRRHCVAPEHLSWQTRDEQLRHKLVDGSVHWGPSHPSAKFSEADVRRALDLVAGGASIRQAAAAAVGASPTTVNRWRANVRRYGRIAS